MITLSPGDFLKHFRSKRFMVGNAEPRGNYGFGIPVCLTANGSSAVIYLITALNGNGSSTPSGVIGTARTGDRVKSWILRVCCCFQ